jgi:antitoxin MazE
MNTRFRSKIVKIGNSRGVRIPRVILEQAGLPDEVELVVKGNTLVIQGVQNPRQGWRAQFASMAEQGDDRLLDPVEATQWDEQEWTW